MWPHLELHGMLWGAAAVLWTVAALAALSPPRSRRVHQHGLARMPVASPWRSLGLLIPAIGLTWVGARAHYLLARDPASLTSLAREFLALVGGRSSLVAEGGAPPPGLHIAGGLLLAAVWLAGAGPLILQEARASSPQGVGAGRWPGRQSSPDPPRPPWTTGDILDRVVPPAGWAIALGRLGCLADGCCFGSIGSWPWCLRYPVGSPPQLNHLARGLLEGRQQLSLPIHPLPLYLALGAVLAALAARAVATDTRSGSRATCFVVVLATTRLLAEQTRETQWAPLVPGVTAISAAIVSLALGVVLALQATRRGKKRQREACRPQSAANHARWSSASEP